MSEIIKANVKNYEIQVLRAIAVSGVVIFHYFTPLSERFFIPPLQYMSYGVELFFIISGWAITSQISRKKTAKKFLKSRFLRIYPALLIIIPINYILDFYSKIDSSRIDIINFIPSLTLFDPYIMQNITGINFQFITDVMWSLSVEVYFYFLVCIIFFKTKDISKLLTLIVIISLEDAVLRLVSLNFSSNIILYHLKLNNLFGWHYLFYFAIGICVYLNKEVKINNKIYFSLFISFILENYQIKSDKLGNFLASAVVISGFYLVLKLNFSKLRKILIMGNVSYEIYLVHNPIGHLVGYLTRGVDSLLILVLIKSVTALVSFCIAIVINYKIVRPINSFLLKYLKL